jgi:hypothetical protein
MPDDFKGRLLTASTQWVNHTICQWAAPEIHSQHIKLQCTQMNPSYFLAGNGTGGQAMDNKKLPDKIQPMW